ncbi:YjcQ family protein [Tissierellaceae bacterium HCP3S3_D8]
MNKRKIIYSVLTEINKGAADLKAVDYGLSEETFGDIVETIQDEGLIKGATFFKSKGKILITFLNAAKVTIKGIDYLEENSVLSKIDKDLKEASK